MVSAVQSGAFDVHIPKSQTADSLDLQLKNPLQLFYISNSFKYVGQVLGAFSIYYFLIYGHQYLQAPAKKG